MNDANDLDPGPVEQSGWARLGHLIVQLSIVAGTAVAVIDEDVSAGRKAVVLALAAALLSWHGLMVYRWRYWTLPGLRFAGSMLVATALWVPLLLLHGGFRMTVIAAYAVAACPFLARAAISVAVLSAIFLAVSAIDGDLAVGEAAGVLLSGLAVVVVHGLIGRVHRQNVRQGEVIAELQSTRTELANRERDAGVMAERERLSRDIHDSLAQGFISILMLLEAADAQLDPDAADVRARIDQARQAAREHLVEARRVVWALRPGPLERGALAGALEVLVDTSFPTGGVDATFRVDGEPSPLAPDQEVVLFRAAQETMSNVARHAGATRMVCTLTFLDDETILDVNDNGRGFDVRQPVPRPDGGLGLVGLRERVGDAGGSLHVDSAPGGGTTVTITLPFANTAEAREGTEAETSP